MLDSMRKFKAGIFQALAHPMRVGIVEFLQHGELAAAKLCEKLDVDDQALSQHLAILKSKQIITSRRPGDEVLFALRDPTITRLLNELRAYYLAHISEILALLRKEQATVDRKASLQEDRQ